jgi:hypothetical protein
MVVHVKERKFLYTVRAAQEIAALCKDGDISNLMELMETDSLTKRVANIINIICSLNKGYEQAKEFEEPGYTADVITAAELECVPLATLYELEIEALAAFGEGTKTTVEVEPSSEKN